VGLARIGNMGDVARVSISNAVLDGLNTTVGKLDMVLSVGRITITSLVLSKLDVVVVGVLSIDTISVFVLGRCRLIGGLMVSTVTMGSGSATTESKTDTTGSWFASLGEGDDKKRRENNEDLYKYKKWLYTKTR
jgi:hypothetical protein